MNKTLPCFKHGSVQYNFVSSLAYIHQERVRSVHLPHSAVFHSARCLARACTLCPPPQAANT